MNTYDVGDLVHLTAGFIDPAGMPIDPTSVALTVQHNTTTETPPVVSDGVVGSYHCDVMISEPGLWYYRWTSTGACATAEEGMFQVRQPFSAQPPQMIGAPPITQATLDALNLAIATGVKVVRFQDRTVEYQSIDDMIKAANYLYGLLYPGGAPGGINGGGYRQIRFYTNKGL